VRSKNSKAMTAAERAHVERVKELPCSVCDLAGPSDAHHIKQGQHWTVVALCKACHQDSRMGWHGAKFAWHIEKMDELDALAVTIQRLMRGYIVLSPLDVYE
jgi:hypothetical protein